MLLVSMWLVFEATEAGLLFARGEGRSDGPIPWIKANASATAFFPWIVWLLRESLTGSEHENRRIIRRSLPWLVFAVALASICVTDWYIPADSTPINQKRGPAYFLEVISVAVAYGYLVISTRRQLRAASGIRRVELQFLVVNFGVAALVAVAFQAAGNVLQLVVLKQVGLLVILGFYALTAWALFFYRVFDVGLAPEDVTAPPSQPAHCVHSHGNENSHRETVRSTTCASVAPTRIGKPTHSRGFAAKVRA